MTSFGRLATAFSPALCNLFDRMSVPSVIDYRNNVAEHALYARVHVQAREEKNMKWKSKISKLKCSLAHMEISSVYRLMLKVIITWLCRFALTGNMDPKCCAWMGLDMLVIHLTFPMFLIDASKTYTDTHYEYNFGLFEVNFVFHV